MTCAPTFATPASELAELAAECLAIERHHTGMFSADTAGKVMRDALADHARDLGIPADQISAAIEAAIKAASGAT